MDNDSLRKLEQRLKGVTRERDEYKTVFEEIEDGYTECDLSGNAVYFNPAYCRLIGYDPAEVPGMGLDAGNDEKAFNAFNEVYRTGKPNKSFNYEILRKDGTRRIVEISISLKKMSRGCLRGTGASSATYRTGTMPNGNWPASARVSKQFSGA